MPAPTPHHYDEAERILCGPGFAFAVAAFLAAHEPLAEARELLKEAIARALAREAARVTAATQPRAAA